MNVCVVSYNHPPLAPRGPIAHFQNSDQWMHQSLFGFFCRSLSVHCVGTPEKREKNIKPPPTPFPSLRKEMVFWLLPLSFRQSLLHQYGWRMGKTVSLFLFCSYVG